MSKSPLELFSDNYSVIAQYCNNWGMFSLYAKMAEAYNANDSKNLARIAHQAWARLPDTREIRTLGFFALCDIAEHIFDEEDDESDNTATS